MLAVSNFPLFSQAETEKSPACATCLFLESFLFLFYNKTFALLIWNLHTEHARPRSVTENKMSVKLDVKDAYGLTHFYGLDPRK